MKKMLLYSLSIFIFIGCSFKTPPDEWKFKAVNAFESYTKNFLSSNDMSAKNDLTRAVENAKVSADLTSLARIYLGKCALNISIGIKDECKKYQNIQDLLNNKNLDAYYSFIKSDIKEEQISFLPKTYQDFAQYIKNSKFNKANNEIMQMNKPSSILLSASLMKNNLYNKTRDKIIKTASFYGYKKAVIFWLNEKRKKINDMNEKKKISKIIFILTKEEEDK